MKLIVCIANNNGILFNGRRVSKDEAVIRDIAKNTPNVDMTEYSRRMFESYQVKAVGDEYFFVEQEFKDTDKAEEIIVYKWNRDYPADLFFEFRKTDFELLESKDFAGKSHERITKEIWKRKG